MKTYNRLPVKDITLSEPKQNDGLRRGLQPADTMPGRMPSKAWSTALKAVEKMGKEPKE